MNQVAIVIPVTVGNSVIAENMIDWIFQLNFRKQIGHAVICHDELVHPERRERIKLACELAFISFDEIVVPSRGTLEKPASENFTRNNLFLGAAEHCQKSLRVPWLWLEPGSCPKNPLWFVKICNAYYSQVRRYSGTHLKPSADGPIFLHPVSVYHMGAFNDVSKVVSESMDEFFEAVSGQILHPKSTKWRLVQPLKILEETDCDKVWDEAQIVFGDDAGILVENLRSKGVHFPKPLNLDSDRNQEGSQIQPVKIDRRTKEGRALAKAQHAN